LIQYSPTTDQVLETPLVIFPPWINRFYILDLNPKKSFIRWAVEQGLTVFMVSWKSADESLVDTTMDDYVLAQIDAIETIRDPARGRGGAHDRLLRSGNQARRHSCPTRRARGGGEGRHCHLLHRAGGFL
jgi:hypothetical protein